MGAPHQDYRILDHTADLGIIVTGRTLEGLFENACRALVDLLFSRLPAASSRRPRRMRVEGRDLNDLMVRWLGEILYLFEADRLIPASVSITGLTPTGLDAVLETFPFDPAVHEIEREIKAVTYHRIRVSQGAGGWEARVIFDV